MSSFEEVLDDVLAVCDHDTLIIFDVDDTLISGKDRLAKWSFPPLFKVAAFNKYPELFDTHNWELAVSIMLEQAERFVVDTSVMSFIHQLKQKNGLVIALTGMRTGALGVIECLEQWRYEMLRQFDIDFKGQFKDVIFDALPSYCGNYPTLYNGILFTNVLQRKGIVLGAFLDHFDLNPRRIIAFDDRIEYLISIGQECYRRNIAFYGYLCQAAKQFVCQWDMQQALAQLDSVMLHGRWLPDACF